MLCPSSGHVCLLAVYEVNPYSESLRQMYLTKEAADRFENVGHSVLNLYINSIAKPIDYWEDG